MPWFLVKARGARRSKRLTVSFEKIRSVRFEKIHLPLFSLAMQMETNSDYRKAIRRCRPDRIDDEYVRVHCWETNDVHAAFLALGRFESVTESVSGCLPKTVLTGCPIASEIFNLRPGYTRPST